MVILIITGNLIRKLRREAGLTQKKLAELAGVSQAHIAKIEKGKVDPRLSTVNKIIEVLAKGSIKKCRDVMTKGVLFVKPEDNVLKVSEVMVKHAISQLPVLDENKVVGTITEEIIVRNLGANIAKEQVKKVMGPPLPMVSEETSIETARSLLEKHQGVLVTGDNEILGIITRSDLLKIIG